MTVLDLARRLLTREVRTFLLVGGAGYVVDVGAFNVLGGMHPFSTLDPSVARTLAVLAAMVVTYVGNRTLTWRGGSERGRRREIALFVLFNVIGFGFSVLTLVVSHDLLHLTSRLADNISANVVGLALGTAFRFVTYRSFVFEAPSASSAPGAADPSRVGAHPEHEAGDEQHRRPDGRRAVRHAGRGGHRDEHDQHPDDVGSDLRVVADDQVPPEGPERSQQAHRDTSTS
ncbi:MAG: GtrA family protein [Nocardioidaceae bacterium]